MSEAVVDASAVLALLLGERGGWENRHLIIGARIGAVNFQEVLVKLIDRGRTPDEALSDIAAINLDIYPHSRAEAVAAARLQSATRAFGLSLGDRSCLALAHSLGATAVTADRAWKMFEVGVDVLTIR